MLNWFVAMTKTINSNAFLNMTSSSNDVLVSDSPLWDVSPTRIGFKTATAEELLTLPLIKTMPSTTESLEGKEDNVHWCEKATDPSLQEMSI